MMLNFNLAIAGAVLAFCDTAHAAPQKRQDPAAGEPNLTTQLRLANS